MCAQALLMQSIILHHIRLANMSEKICILISVSAISPMSTNFEMIVVTLNKVMDNQNCLIFKCCSPGVISKYEAKGFQNFPPRRGDVAKLPKDGLIPWA